jgi:hypothetical protein
MNNFEITNEAVNQVRDNNFNYYSKVLAFAEIWVTTQMKAFTSENLKEAFYKKGNTKPNEPRVFGSIFRELSKNHLIFRNGYQKSTNPVCHPRPQTLWISKEFKLKQQANAVKDKNQISIFN